MTENDLLDAIGDIDPAYLEEAKNHSRNFKRKWIALGSLAACLVLLLIPLGLQHYWLAYESVDYTAQAHTKCCIYYVRDHAVYYESADVWGGDQEMFEIWKSKNGISDKAVLQSLVLSSEPVDDKDRVDTVFVKLPSSLERYFENEEGILRKDALKKTIASYRDITVDTIELIFV